MKCIVTFIAFATASMVSSSHLLMAQNVGIGTSAPKTLLQISKGSTGITPHTLAPLTLESTNNNYLQFLSVANKEAGLLFGNPTGIAQGGIVYNNPGNPEGLDFRTNGNIVRMTIDNNGSLGLRGNNPGKSAILVSKDQNGNTDWQKAYAFRVEGLLNPSAEDIPDLSNARIYFQTQTVYNLGFLYNVGTSQFTAPVKGIYNFSAKIKAREIEISNQPGLFRLMLMLKRNGVVTRLAIIENSIAVYGGIADFESTNSNVLNEDVLLEANDLVWLEYTTNHKHRLYGLGDVNSFSGRLVTQLY